MTLEWDAVTYDRIAEPQTRWGLAVLDRLPLAGDEVVLDAGCGTGRVTEQLVRRLPRGRVIALDASAAMLAEARRRLAPYREQVDFVEADLAAPLPVPSPVDAVLSTATFHWVLDHDALFAHLAAVLRPGGMLVAQCGGAGNIAGVLAVLEDVGRPLHHAHWATPAATVPRLYARGFTDVWAWLHDEPTAFASPADLEAFLATVVLRAHLAGIPEEERDAFVRDVAGRLPGAEIDNVRLNILARRAHHAPLRVTTSVGDGDVVVVEVAGDLAGGAVHDLRHRLDGLFGEGGRKFVVDLGGVGVVDGSGLAVLVDLFKRVRIGTGDVRLCRLRPEVERVFELLRLLRVFAAFASRADAVESFR